MRKNMIIICLVIALFVVSIAANPMSNNVICFDSHAVYHYTGQGYNSYSFKIMGSDNILVLEKGKNAGLIICNKSQEKINNIWLNKYSPNTGC